MTSEPNETVGRIIRRWLSWSVNLPVRSEEKNPYPSQESNSISSCPGCSLVSVQTYRKKGRKDHKFSVGTGHERIANNVSCHVL